MTPIRMIRSALFLGLGLCALATALPAFALPIVIDLAAQVDYVDDPTGLLAGAVQVGDAVTSRYAYESTTLDSNPLAEVGDYRQSSAPFGIEVHVSGLTFRTDPGQVDFLVELCDDHGTVSPHDAYVLRSYRNLFDVSAVPEWEFDFVDNHIAWQLFDPTATVWSSPDLPAIPPPLTGWGEGSLGLEISSSNYSASSRFLIRADVTSVHLAAPAVPEPATWALLAVGLCGIVVRRSRLRPGRACANLPRP